MTHPDSPEFLAILESVPRWHMLTPRKKCDSCDGTGGFTRDGENNEFDDNYEIIECAECGGVGTIQEHMKIPEHVRRSEAWFQLLSAVCREHSGNPDYSTVIYVCLSQGATISGVFGPDLAEKLGTDDDCEKFMEEGPGAYTRWVLNV